jgi:hypothetical protein
VTKVAFHPGKSWFSYGSYQLPERAPASLEELLGRVLGSYRPAALLE